MLASPSIQEIASALARAPRPATAVSSSPSVRSPSRVLCLRLEARLEARIGSAKPRSWKSIAEAFLKYSPRVQVRTLSAGEGPSWVFIDIASTSHLFHGEEGLLRSAASLAQDLGFGVQCAVADTPAGAQAFAMVVASETRGVPHALLSGGDRPGASFFISPPGEERDRLKELSLPFLLYMEGLEAWARPSAVESVITFFMMLGFKRIGDLSRFTSSALQERWGELGGTLWKRLNALDRQAISPLLPTEPLQDYVHLDFPVSLVSLLLRQTEKSVDFLFARLQGRRLFAQKLVLTLHCEYSKTQHQVVIEPNTPSRDRDLFLTLLEKKLSDLNLENPIRDLELDVLPCPEKSHQLDFFEPRTTDRDKLQTLMSLLSQSSLKPGLYRIEPAVLPERGWRLASSDTAGPVAALVQKDACADDAELAVSSGNHPSSRLGTSVMLAPRPTRILKEPIPLAIEELERMKILSSHPIERLESGWWETSETKRDYYFAVSREGQCLWIYQDLRTEEYFLHGYFD